MNKETTYEYDGYRIPERGPDTAENRKLRERALKEAKEQARSINAFYAQKSAIQQK